MGAKYRGYQHNRGISREERRRIHPIWRGVGFILMILIPIISYAGAEVLLDLNGQNNWFPVPFDLIAKPGDFLYSYFPDTMIHIKLLIMVVIAVILFGVFTWISFIVIGSLGMTERNDPYYVAPVRVHRRRRN